MTIGLSKYRRRFRKLLLLNLVEHKVPKRDQEWFAQCKLNHTSAFPYLPYDIVRGLVSVLLYQLFMPGYFVLLVGVIAGLIAARQAIIQSWVRSDKHSTIKAYNALRDLVVVRAVAWGVIFCIGLLNAPVDLFLGLIAGGLVIMMIDAFCMIAMPKRALLAAIVQGIGLAVPLIMLGTTSSMIGLAALVSLLIFTHWGVFNLNYMFATRRLRTRKLSTANDTIQLLLNQYDEDGSDWLFECDEQGKILRPSYRFCKAANRKANYLDGLRLSLLFKDSPEREELRAIGDREEAFRDLVIPLEVDGEDRWWSISARPVYDPDGGLECWRGFIGDVTRTRQAEDKVAYMAHYDVLTNLPNRSLFNSSMRRAFNRRKDDQVSAVLYIDLDHFKAVNDSYGHAIGDKVLAEAARRIEGAIDSTTMVARLGADEFAVLLDHIDNRNDALLVAQDIVTAMDEPITVDGQELPLGASVGVAFAPDNGLSGEEVLKAADLALYDAKSRGRRGTSLFDPTMQLEAHERRTMELDLRAALGNGELEVHYQPLLQAETTEIVGYEALLRWNHPEKGSISPAVFIPIAEETGQIVSIGAWVLREALREAANWPVELSVSVNLSPAQMRDEGLLNTIVGALASSGVSSDRLELEITETLLMQDNEDTIALLHRIRDLGVRIALDDFGTGYSSLNYLRSFPFDKIKIDRCFVADIADKEDSDAIVQAVIDLASKLKMRTTAEGVENAEQLSRLQESGCDLVQGFLFSKAKPAAQLGYSLGSQSNVKVTKLSERQAKPASDTVGATKDRKAS